MLWPFGNYVLSTMAKPTVFLVTEVATLHQRPLFSLVWPTSLPEQTSTSFTFRKQRNQAPLRSSWNHRDAKSFECMTLSSSSSLAWMLVRPKPCNSSRKQRRSTSTGGPFESETEFNNFLFDNMISSMPLLYSQSIWQTIRRDHELVFSHGDLELA